MYCKFGNGCDKTFYVVKTLDNHYRDVHKLKSKELTCHECSKKFLHKSDYIDHKEEHKVGLGSKLYACTVCNEKFHFKRELEKHVENSFVHRGKECKKCKMKFNSTCALAAHRELLHTKKQPIERHCSQCGEKFKSEEDLGRHMRKEHQPAGPFFCELCGHKSPRPERHLRHMEIHNERNIQCDQCEKMFKSESYLERHQLATHTHDSERPHKCETCGRGFATKSSYDGHMNMHLGLKPFICHICNKGFQNDSNRRAHIKKVHNQKP